MRIVTVAWLGLVDLKLCILIHSRMEKLITFILDSRFSSVSEFRTKEMKWFLNLAGIGIGKNKKWWILFLYFLMYSDYRVQCGSRFTSPWTHRRQTHRSLKYKQKQFLISILLSSLVKARQGSPKIYRRDFNGLVSRAQRKFLRL